MSVNNVVYQGNITKDLDLRYSQSGMAILSFSIGVSRNFTDKNTGKRESDFINCKAFGKTAEAIANHFRKGSEILVTGRTQTGSYEGQDGQRKYTTDCMVETFNFTRGSNPSNGEGQQNNNANSNKGSYNNNPDPFGSASQIDINDNDLPF